MSNNPVAPFESNKETEGPPHNSWKTKVKEYLAKLKTLIINPNESHLTKSLSVAVGVFISIVPLWGLQTMVAIAAAFIFRLNKPLVIAASYLSAPPITPVVLYVSVILGGFFVSKPVIFSLSSISIDVIQAALFQYVIGSLVFAVAASFFFGFATSFVLKISRK